ncbi:MAG: sulfatase [Candidatus Brocadiia bacterium]
MSQSEQQASVIWIFGDQHRAQATGYAGDPNVSTPNLDRMATEGMAFRRAVSGFPLCCPYRGSLMTGRYPHNCVPGHECRMPPEQPTIAHAFGEAGYETAYFGKWHLDGWHESDGRAAMHIVPPERRGGFDTWVGYDNNNAQWDSWVHGGQGDDAFHYRLPGYETDCLTDMLIEYLEQCGETPFFAVLSVQPPHDPYVAPAEWMDLHAPAGVELRPNVADVDRVVQRARRELAGYYAQIENLDWNVGRVLAALEENGLAEETYVVFFSDHGDMHGSHGQFRKTGPYEEAIRVPFIIYHPRGRYTHRHGSPAAPINHVDVAPTTLGLCGIEAPEAMAGTDYSGLYRRNRPTDEVPDSAYLQSVIPTGHGDSVDRPWRGIVTTDGWKYVCLEGQPWLMFNLNEDPYEQANLAHNTRFRSDQRRLQDRLAAWVSDTGDEFPLPEL